MDTQLTQEEKDNISTSYGLIVGFGTLALVICGTRLCTRKFILDAFSLDDYVTFIALICTTAFNAVGIAVVANGAGRHIENVPENQLATFFKLYYAATCIYLLIAFFVKASLLAFLWRLFPTSQMRTIIKYLFIFMVLFTVSGSFLDAFQCNPPRYTYQLDLLMSPDHLKYCFSNDVSYGVFMYQAVVMFSIDIVIFILPLPTILSLNISRAKGIALLLIFSSGIVACIAPAVRIQSLQFFKTGSTDLTVTAASSLYWMCIEYNLGIIAGSLGCLRPLFARMGLISVSGTGSGGSGRKMSNMSPAYPLGDMPSSNGGAGGARSGTWRNGAKAGRVLSKDRHRVQGDSVLDMTVVTQTEGEADGESYEGARMHSKTSSQEKIIKTQEVTVVYGDKDQGFENPYKPRFHVRQEESQT